MRLALMGYKVTAIEQSPIMAIMLRDGLHRALQDNSFAEDMGGRVTIIEGDSLHILHDLRETEVVYIDPMFPQKRKKSALPPGRIQALHTIVGYEDPVKTKQLITISLQHPVKRVVVKQPKHKDFAHTNPLVVHQGKTIRYEVYAPPTKYFTSNKHVF